MSPPLGGLTLEEELMVPEWEEIATLFSVAYAVKFKVKKTLAEGESSPSARIAGHYLELAREHRMLLEKGET